MSDSLAKSMCDVLPIYAWYIVLPIYYADDKAENAPLFFCKWTQKNSETPLLFYRDSTVSLSVIN